MMSGKVITVVTGGAGGIGKSAALLATKDGKP